MNAKGGSVWIQSTLSEQVILTLAKTIDVKDKYKNELSERVVAYSREILKDL